MPTERPGYKLMTADALRIGDTLLIQGRGIPVRSLLFNRGRCMVRVNGSFDFEDCDVVRIAH